MLLTSSVLLLATACLCVIYTESNKNKLINNKSLRNNGWDVSPLKEDDIQHVKLNKHSLYHCSISQLIHYTECCWWKGLRCWLIMASINSVFYKIEPKKRKKGIKKQDRLIHLVFDIVLPACQLHSSECLYAQYISSKELSNLIIRCII